MDRDAIAEGVALISQMLSKGRGWRAQLQAAIAAVHDEAARAEDTDWPQIRALRPASAMSDNPMVALNHAIAAAMVHGRRRVSTCYERWMPTNGWPATIGWLPRAHLLEMSGIVQPPSSGIRPRPPGRRAYRSGIIC